MIAWGIGYVTLGVVIATAIAWPVYESQRTFVIAGVALALAAGIVLAARRFRLPWWAVILIAIVAYALAVVPLAVPSALGSPAQLFAGLRDGVAGITLGWKQLLTLELPLGEYQAVLVPFLVTIYLLALIAIAVIVRGGRLATIAVPAVFVMSAFGIAFGSSNTSDSLVLGDLVVPAVREVVLGVALVLLSLVWLIGRGRLARVRALRAARAQTGTVRQRGESIAIALRRNILAILIVAIALAAGVVITPFAATLEPRQALRDGVDPLLVLQQEPSPLSAYRGWFEGDRFDEELFTVQGGQGAVDRIRIATLDAYDGETFHVSGAGESETGRFNHLPRTTPTSGSPSQLTITIGDGYSGIWVPVPDGLAAAPSFSGSRAAQLADAFYISAESSSTIDVATDGDSAPGLRPGDSYTVYADQVTTGVEALGTESPGSSLLGDALLPAMEDWVKLQAAPRNAEGLVGLIDSLRARGYISHAVAEPEGTGGWVGALADRASFVFQPSYSGHSQSRVEALFTTLIVQQRLAGEDAEDDTLVSAVGDDEQFATAAALLARYYGFESRVVIGVRLDSDDPDLAVEPCADVCTGGNVSAWVEVRRSGGAWVSIDTTPQFVEAPATITTGVELPHNPTVPDEVQSEVVDPPEVDRGNSDLLSDPQASGDDWLANLLPTIRVVGLSALAALLLVLPILVLAFAKSSRRRWRRGNRVPEVAIVGAWDELVDTYLDHGMSLPRASSRRDFAIASARPAALALATMVDRAVFAEHPPLRDESTASWELLDAERRQLDEVSTLGQRIKARLSPTSFLRQLGSETPVGAVLSLFTRKDPHR